MRIRGLIKCTETEENRVVFVIMIMIFISGTMAITLTFKKPAEGREMDLVNR
ncbi:MAG: hypothetical protein ACYSUY_01790 [Planctomycetota bacterium]|jgi:hypothetical protein